MRGRANVDLELSDLADEFSPSTLANTLRARHGKVDVVLQSGAYMARASVSAAEGARPMRHVNSHGTLRTLRALLPILSENARLLSVNRP